MKKTTGITEILLSGIFFGTIPIFSAFLHRLEVSSFQQAFFRFLISILVLAGFVFFFKGAKYDLVKRQDLPIFLAYGFFLSMAYVTYLSSISLGTPVGKAVFLTYTQPLFTMLLGMLFLNERITTTKAAAAFFSVAGAALILQVWAVKSFASFLFGDVLAVFNGLFYASFIITGRYIRKGKKYGHAETTVWSFVFGMGCLLAVWFLLGFVTHDANLVGFSLGLPTSGWFFMFCLAIVSTLLPYFLLNLGLKEVKASQAGVILLVEPLVVVLLGALFLKESLGFWQVAGGALILLSVAMISRDTK